MIPPDEIAFATVVLGGALIALGWLNRLFRKNEVDNLYRASKRQRVRTIIKERGHEEQIVGDVPFMSRGM